MSLPAKEMLSIKQECIAAEMLTPAVIDLAFCGFDSVSFWSFESFERTKRKASADELHSAMHRQSLAAGSLGCTMVHAQDGYSSLFASHLPLHAS